MQGLYEQSAWSWHLQQIACYKLVQQILHVRRAIQAVISGSVFWLEIAAHLSPSEDQHSLSYSLAHTIPVPSAEDRQVAHLFLPFRNVGIAKILIVRCTWVKNETLWWQWALGMGTCFGLT